MYGKHCMFASRRAGYVPPVDTLIWPDAANDCLLKSSRPCSAPWLSLLLMAEAGVGQELLIGQACLSHLRVLDPLPWGFKMEEVGVRRGNGGRGGEKTRQRSLKFESGVIMYRSSNLVPFS